MADLDTADGWDALTAIRLNCEAVVTLAHAFLAPARPLRPPERPGKTVQQIADIP
ncbi:hypothetical protein OG594_45115 [Streptomyces sp. NBC_01214]|uniref:hypothetical protein n=1 Tax=Streptomyces sp. NBC_01214 TaxID=2903777 RepID=UPI002250F9BB|nr:hypothetical protein [Streptomyces sp. NBC_01214]MCX4808671.1 hypothetical protein [Streptomyces sp. NBC_01214]